MYIPVELQYMILDKLDAKSISQILEDCSHPFRSLLENYLLRHKDSVFVTNVLKETINNEPYEHIPLVLDSVKYYTYDLDEEVTDYEEEDYVLPFELQGVFNFAKYIEDFDTSSPNYGLEVTLYFGYYTLLKRYIISSDIYYSKVKLHKIEKWSKKRDEMREK